MSVEEAEIVGTLEPSQDASSSFLLSNVSLVILKKETEKQIIDLTTISEIPASLVKAVEKAYSSPEDRTKILEKYQRERNTW